MKVLTAQQYDHIKILVNAPETDEEFNYLCNLALAQHMFVDPKWTFFKLLNNERHYIRHIVAMMNNDYMFGLSIIWDYTRRAVEKEKAPDEETLFDYGFVKHAVGVFVPTWYRRGKVGSLLVNQTMESFQEPVFANANTFHQQQFWSSPCVDKTYLKFMLTDNETVRVSF